MMQFLKKNNWLVVKVVVLITILIPLSITTYEFIILGNESVVFLADYPSVVGVIVVVYYSLLLVVGLLWLIKQLIAILNLKNETKKSELLHLQSQVNPHFFFNMLNNVYGMVDKDTDGAKDLILKLSDLMRYSIYEGEKETVTLAEEISYLQNYIALHKMRYHKKIDIEFIIDVVDDTLKIRPLLLIILLENAFKHGVENLREKAYVAIHLKTGNERLLFEIKNNFDQNEITETKGIGLKNLKRRLALAYPKKHQLSVEKNNIVFKAQLELHV
ncbi:sensor histidine kinase [Maribacter forsetii]|uniref:sensor histidine kinase n=1 Tax=Maribacter forsetii TaxID=444515 RepID=UPI00055A9695|nr:histidine kinase [Maribacter forsetii]